jgi:hypothetical protein
MGGCTLIVDPFGVVRYAVYKRLDSAERQRRQYASVKGPLRKYWRKDGGRFTQRGGTFRMLHDELRARDAGTKSHRTAPAKSRANKAAKRRAAR